MPYSSNDLSGTLSDRFNWFCQQVGKMQSTPDLISFVAGEAMYVNFCRDIINADKVYQKHFVGFCRKNKLDETTLRKRLGKVATVLGIGKHMDYYEILGVSSDANDQAIKKAYRKKAQLFHPDKVHGNKPTSDKFVELHAAYVHLSDPSLRKVYDQSDGEYNQWVESESADVFKIQKQGPGFGRFFGWLCVLVGMLVCVIYLFDIYHTESISSLSEKSDEALLEESNKKFRAALKKMAIIEGADTTSPTGAAGTVQDGLKIENQDSSISGSNPAGAGSDNGDADLFYNPRRDSRYWIRANSRHDTLERAIASLATMYGRTPEWVYAYMGSDNLLGSIHRNLTRQQALEDSSVDPMNLEGVLQAQVSKPVEVVAAAAPVVTPEAPKKIAKAPKKTIPVVAVAAAKEVTAQPKAKKASVRPDRKKRAFAVPKNKGPVDAAAPRKRRASVKATVQPTPSAKAQPKSVLPMAAAKISAIQKPGAADAAKKLDKQRILSFLENYTAAYEQKDIERFQQYFTQDATEMGKSFKSLLPTYQNTFQRVEALQYDIDMTAFSSDKVAKTFHLNGMFEAKYRLPQKEWASRSGSIRMELLDSAVGLLVRRLEYEMDP